MKKFILVISIMIFTAFLFNEAVYGFMSSSEEEQMLSSLSKKLIRFHVIANSDDVKDQELKLKVKDEVLKFMAPKLEKSISIEDSRALLKKYDKEIKRIAEQVIKKNGYNYKVNTSLAKVDFPVKAYGTISLPQGNYEAYRILIGEAKGQNWWCVMFPPLCFVDVTKGEVADEKTAEVMKRVLSKDEYDFINNGNGDIQLKFKAVEIFNDIKELIIG